MISKDELDTLARKMYADERHEADQRRNVQRLEKELEEARDVHRAASEVARKSYRRYVDANAEFNRQ